MTAMRPRPLLGRVALALAVFTAGAPVSTQTSDDRQQAAIWYEAFSKHDPDLLGTVLEDDWLETPSAERGGKQAAMELLVSLTIVFPDFGWLVR